MDKIKKFVMDNYKLMIPILFMVVLFIAFLIYYQVSIHSNYHVDTEEKVYQYFSDNKYEYNAIVSKNRKGVIVDFKPIDVKINIDSTPIYINDKKGNVVILPRNMSVVMPTMSCAEYLAKGYSYITFKNGVFNLTTDRYDGRLNHYFLYDGGDLYFFIEKVTLKVNNEEISLSPYSYIIANYGGYLSYYDKESDTYKTLTINNHDIVVSNEYYKILVDKDIIDYQGTNVILSSKLDKLNTIDKKGQNYGSAFLYTFD